MRYYGLRRDFRDDDDRAFVVKNLINLKKNVCAKVPAKNTNSNLLIGTWNIRDFNSNKFGHGYRLAESFYYIAEIISAFDLVAVQEVNKDLSGLNKLMYTLGPDWDFIATDVTAGSSGNMERMAFIFDKRRVTFRKIAGEVVLPKGNDHLQDIQFARTPFLVSFQAGWTKFSLCTVHIYYGSDSATQMQRRVNEIKAIANFLKERADADLENIIVLGDFNIIDQNHETMQALTSTGFQIPTKIFTDPFGANANRTKHYDQIAIYSKANYFSLTENDNSSGTYDYYKDLFKYADFSRYQKQVTAIVSKQQENVIRDLAREQAKQTPDTVEIAKLTRSIAKFEAKLSNVAELKKYYHKEWKTFQMSDHLPMWAELSIDHSETYLRSILNSQTIEDLQL